MHDAHRVTRHRVALQRARGAVALGRGQLEVDDGHVGERVGDHDVLEAGVLGVAVGEVPVVGGRIGAGATAEPSGSLARCSTNPPPPVISTSAPTYVPPGCIAPTSILAVSRGATSSDWVTGAPPGVSVSTVTWPDSGVSTGLATTTSPPMPAPTGAPGQNHDAVMKSGRGTNGVLGAPSEVNTGVNGTGRDAPATISPTIAASTTTIAGVRALGPSRSSTRLRARSSGRRATSGAREAGVHRRTATRRTSRKWRKWRTCWTCSTCRA